MEYQLRTSLLPQEKNYTVVERVFANRGIEPKNISHYLHTTDNDILDPSLITNIKEGAAMLVRHIQQKDKTMVIVDSDADGFTSSAFLLNYLNCLFPSFIKDNVEYALHEEKTHGIILDAITEDTKLVIVPDASSNEYEIHKQLKDRGCDVLCIDHHQAPKVSEYACVINNQLCDYPTKSLSGVGMVYKFCSYLDELLETNYADNFLDLAAVGILADMMSLKDYETKHIINKGLNNVQNPFLKEICDAQAYSISRAGGLCPFAVSFYIAPQINATTRVGTMEEKILLFESMLDFKGYEEIPSTKRGCKGKFETKAAQACRNCTKIKRRQSEVVESSLDIIENIIEEKNLAENKVIAVKLQKEQVVNRSLTGLIANQLMAKYKHPILILLKGEDGTWSGSGRGFDTVGFNNFRDFIEQSGLAEYSQGHPDAFGTSFTEENFKAFIEYSNKVLKDCAFLPYLTVDFIWDSNNFSGKDIIELAKLNCIWGQGLEKPYIMIRDIHVTPDSVNLLSRDKNPTLKITLNNGVSLIKFKSSEEEYQSLLASSDLGSVDINVIGTCKINEWNGIISPQMEIEQYEIVRKVDYFF
jgi:single-stranded-DNA-specific exonuclease